MIEDPLYLPKTTPVYMIGDFNNMQVYDISKQVEKEWNKFGYKVTRYKQIPHTQYDFFPYVTDQFNGLNTNIKKLNFISHVALWKKLRKFTKPCMIINYDSYLLKDIPRDYFEKKFFYLYTPPFISGETLPTIDKLNSYFIHPRTCHLLYDAICKYDRPINRIEEFIYRFTEEKYERNKENYTFKYVL